MKTIKYIASVLFLALCCTSYAHQSEYIFIGQSEKEGITQTNFILEVVGDDLEDRLHMNENGELCLKVDGLIAMPRASLSDVVLLDSDRALELISDKAVNYGCDGVPPFVSLAAYRNNRDTEDYIRCYNCKHGFYSQGGNRRCPNCGALN